MRTSTGMMEHINDPFLTLIYSLPSLMSNVWIITSAKEVMLGVLRSLSAFLVFYELDLELNCL